MSTFKPLSQYNAFFKLARERNLCGLDQLVGLHITNKFNQAHWTDTLLLADAELLECINWYDKTGSPTSIDSIRIAKARLKKKGFIDFRPGKGNKPTEYRLIQLYPSDTPSDIPPDTPSETPSDSGLVCYTACAPKKMLLDVKTPKKENLSICSAGAREEQRREMPAVVFAMPKNREEEKANEEVEEIDELQEYWENEIRGGKLTFEHLSKLEAYLKTKGLKWLKEAMKETANENNNPYGSSPKLLFGVIAKKEKGGITVEGKPEPPKHNYTVPVRTGKEEWNIDDGDEE